MSNNITQKPFQLVASVTCPIYRSATFISCKSRNKLKKSFLRKNIVAVLFFKTGVHSHILNTKHPHYLNSLKHGYIHI